MAKRPATGRDSIFRGKDLKAIIRGAVTPKGREAFERRRKELAKRTKRPVEHVSDGDLIEYLARGPEALPKEDAP